MSKITHFGFKDTEHLNAETDFAQLKSQRILLLPQFSRGSIDFYATVLEFSLLHTETTILLQNAVINDRTFFEKF